MSGRISDAFESLANAALGLVISVLAVHIFWPLFGWQVGTGQAVGVTAIFFGLSMARVWVLRRLFRWIGGRQ